MPVVMIQMKYEQTKEVELVTLGSPFNIANQSSDTYKPAFATSIFSETWVLAHRCTLTTFRSKIMFITRISLQVRALSMNSASTTLQLILSSPLLSTIHC